MPKCVNCKNWIGATAECAYLLMCYAIGMEPDQAAADATDRDCADNNDCTEYK